MSQPIKSDFLVIGGGIAGLVFALQAAQMGKVNLIVKEDFEASSTQYAQGGINAVLDEADSFEQHFHDTLECGHELCDKRVVERIVEQGPEVIQQLIDYGVNFTKRKTGELSLRQEGGHSQKRVVHVDDATGAAIMEALKSAAHEHKNITIYTYHMAVDLILSFQAGAKRINEHTRSLGAYVLDIKKEKVHPFLAPITYLATGGIGKVYPFTSNPHTATGDGIVMAYRAGVEIANMEFIQFHPTLLFHQQKSNFLISETLRGHGGILKNTHGDAFMQNYAPKKADLAPRDIVAQAIDMEMKKTNKPHVYLDISHLPAEKSQKYFPNIYQTLIELGIDMTTQPIPVLPGAHYVCGGIKVDSHGETNCQGLFAGGECSFTGFHGANRLASNSLLEGVVCALFASEHIQKNKSKYFNHDIPTVAPWIDHNFYDSYEMSLIHPLWREMRQFMWNYVGITRTDKRLERAIRRIQLLQQEIQDYYWNFKLSKDLIELRNISIVSELIIRSAYLRKESRGLHNNVDHPHMDPKQVHNTYLKKLP